MDLDELERQREREGWAPRVEERRFEGGFVIDFRSALSGYSVACSRGYRRGRGSPCWKDFGKLGASR